MSARGGLTAEELLASLRRRQAALPPEIGTFMVFEACEAVVASGPVFVLGENVRIDTEGGVSLLPGGQPADDAQAARSIHALLTSVLLNARPGPSPRLLRLVEEGPSSGHWSLADLRDDLEASLVPLNRHASRRVLARLLREAAADRVRGSSASGRRSFDELDAELADLMGEPALAAPAAPVAAMGSVSVGDGRGFGSAAAPPVEARAVPPRRESRPAEDVAAPPAPGGMGEAHIPTDLTADLGASLRESAYPVGGRSRVGLWVGLGLVLLALGLAGVVMVMRPDALARLRGEEPLTRAPDDPLDGVSPAPRAGRLVLEVAPAGSQVLMRVGTAPVEVEGVAVGQAEEFVATAEGRAPSRALISPQDVWEQTAEGPFFELAMQTRPLSEGQKAKLGESLLPVESGVARRRDGRVRIVTAPRGAEVYRVVGFAPEVRIDHLDTRQGHTFWIVKPGHEPKTLHLRAQDWPVDPEPVLRERVELKRR